MNNDDLSKIAKNTISSATKSESMDSNQNDSGLIINMTEYLVMLMIKAKSKRNPIAGYNSIRDDLRRMQGMNDPVLAFVQCPKCSTVMHTQDSFSTHLILLIFIFLLQEQLISESSMTMPSEDSIEEVFSDEICFDQTMKCGGCGEEMELEMVLNNTQLDGKIAEIPF